MQFDFEGYGRLMCLVDLQDIYHNLHNILVLRAVVNSLVDKTVVD